MRGSTWFSRFRVSFRALALLACLWVPVASALCADAGLKLKLAVMEPYCQLSACKCVHFIATRHYEDFCASLKTTHKIDLELVYFTDSYFLQNAIRNGGFDGAITKPWLVMGDAQGPGKHFKRVADLQDPFGNTDLWGVVYVLKDSPIKTLQDVSTKQLTIGQNDCYENHQALFALLKREKVEMPRNHILERASTLECLDLLLKGDADAAVISNYTLEADCAIDIAKPSQFRVLAETARIPLTSLLLDGQRVTRDNMVRVQQALIECSKTALPESMSGGGFVAPRLWEPSELKN